MKYTKGNIRRIFVLKFEDGDILIDELSKFAKHEKVRSAAFVFIGALKEGDIVTGPKKPIIPPKPNWKKFKNAWEAMGVGTIFSGNGTPQIHIHTSMGQKNRVITGCVRKSSSVFLVVEAIVFELVGVKASKRPDLKTGLNLLKIL
jgi:predicted DNA-binding protein with PD1-like motif